MERVLLVDDDVQLCKLLHERLAIDGFTLEMVHDGRLGLERALSMEHALVVLDLMLPGMGGLDVLRRLRKASPVPVLILTARGDGADRILGLEMGAGRLCSQAFQPAGTHCSHPRNPAANRSRRSFFWSIDCG
jgi:DNA-binding response OmpR family regulator